LLDAYPLKLYFSQLKYVGERGGEWRKLILGRLAERIGIRSMTWRRKRAINTQRVSKALRRITKRYGGINLRALGEDLTILGELMEVRGISALICPQRL